MGTLKKQQKYTLEEFISRARKVHGDTYDYTKVNYINSKTKVIISCSLHGDFSQQPSNHLMGQGCPKCGRLRSEAGRRGTTEEFIKKAKGKHGDKFDYSKVAYVNSGTNILVICPLHGEQFITPSSHFRLHGCSECGREAQRIKLLSNTEEFIEKAKKVHGDRYDYSKVDYERSDKKVCIICPIHGEFWQIPDNHLYGYDCAKCGDDRSRESMLSNTEEFISKARKVHGDRYGYELSEYFSSSTNIKITCPIHGEFEQLANNHLRGYNCPSCARAGHSAPEIELQDFMRSLTKIKVNDRKILRPRELDIYIPKSKLAIEFNGLYWHSSHYVESSYHLDKTNDCADKGVRLIHIFEDEWRDKQEIVKSRLINILGKTPNILYARKCEVKTVPTTEAMQFLDENHIQGRVGGKFKYGLYHEGELVSLMTFGSMRKNMGSTAKEGEYELLRFCNKLNTSVVGGASRLFSRFVNDVQPSVVISYADKRWSTGNLYFQLGFEHVGDTPPNYWYVIRESRENRYKYRKSELVKQGFDENKSEREIMDERGIHRIYDCGNMKFKKTFRTEKI